MTLLFQSPHCDTQQQHMWTVSKQNVKICSVNWLALYWIQQFKAMPQRKLIVWVMQETSGITRTHFALIYTANTLRKPAGQLDFFICSSFTYSNSWIYFFCFVLCPKDFSLTDNNSNIKCEEMHFWSIESKISKCRFIIYFSLFPILFHCYVFNAWREKKYSDWQ